MDISAILASDEVKKHIKDATYPLVNMVYNEIYIYVWFICIYNIFLLALLVINLYLLIRYMRIEKHVGIPHADLA
jgi:hypothetical protein